MHRKKEHSKFVKTCNQFNQNGCRFQKSDCWYKHATGNEKDDEDETNSKSNGKDELETVLQSVSEDLDPPINRLKRDKLIATFMNYTNVTTVPKKGSRIEPKNERGIFRVAVVRSILMRLVYNMKYPIIDG